MSKALELSPQEAACVVGTSDTGRSMVATRSIAPGEVVLREKPSLTWEHEEVQGLVSGFLEAPPPVQLAVLDMATPSVDADLERIDDPAWRQEATASRLDRACDRHALALGLAAGFDGARVLELIETLLLVGDCNAHEFGKRVGLFPLAAIANHSCDPNCGHSTRHGEMRFYATRAIAEGEELTISYLGGLWSTGVRERRATLLREKLFYCRCARCRGADVCRGLHCLEETCGGVACQHGGDGGAWRCQRCGASHEDDVMPAAPTASGRALAWHAARKAHATRLAAEQALADECAALSAGEEVPRPSWAEASALLQRVREQLSPTHPLVCKVLSSPACQAGTREHACAAALHVLGACECAAAGCCAIECARDGVSPAHPPHPALVAEAMSALLHCRGGGDSALEAARTIDARYRGWAALQGWAMCAA